LAAGDAAAALARAVTARQDVAIGLSPGGGVAAGAALLGVPVHGRDGAMVGVLAAPVALSNLGLEAVLGQTPVGEHGAAYLVDGSGQILARSPSAHARASLAGQTGLPVALQDGKPGATMSQTPEGEQTALAYAPLGVGSDWRVIVEEPWHEVMSPVLRYSQAMPLVAALAAVVALLTLYYGIHSLVRPLRALKRQAEQVAWGDFGAAGTPVGGVEEIEDLQRTLDQMAQRIQSYQRGMHDYIAAITQGQEEERRRLARELHDDTAQALIALGQQVELAQKQLATSPERAAERLAAVRRMLAETLEGVRRFSRDLRPIYLEDLGFLPALEMLATEAGQREGLAVELTTAGPVRRLPPDLELTAFRVAQEALNNVVQHAQASHAWVEVRFEPHHLVLTVRDDGRGFEPPDQPDALVRQGHFGLMGIQERALLHGGTVTIRSAPGQGTQITVRLQVP
jgi:signal transduction histidine kinase